MDITLSVDENSVSQLVFCTELNKPLQITMVDLDAAIADLDAQTNLIQSKRDALSPVIAQRQAFHNQP